MIQRRLILAGPLLLACVAAMSAGGRATSATAGPCPRVSVDTRGWQRTRSFELGVELLHPPNYERKMWTSHSPGYPPSLDLWRRPGAPAWVVQLRLLRADSLFPFSPNTHARTLRCRLRTQSEDVAALLERVARSTLPTERDSFYVVRVQLPRADGRTVIAFRGRSADSAGHAEQIAIAQTLRLREIGTPSGNEP